MNFWLSILSIVIIFLYACSPAKQIERSARKNVLDDAALQTAHVGISVFDPSIGKYLYNYQGDKYFVPASNTKIPTCYAAMKYLGDSLVGLRYGIPEEKGLDNTIVIKPAGDPSFLHPDYKNQPVLNFLETNKAGKRFGFLIDTVQVERWGSGWSWNDYDAGYMAERSNMPIYGNTINIRLLDTAKRLISDTSYLKKISKKSQPFITGIKFFDSLLNRRVFVFGDELKKVYPRLTIQREIDQNNFSTHSGNFEFRSKVMPFVTNRSLSAREFLSDSLKKNFTIVFPDAHKNIFEWSSENGDLTIITISKWNVIHSQPTDSLLKPMMHNSDNFFAEQSLVMASNEVLGIMNERKIIDSLINTDFKDLPQKPRWADGSGLSRYNLFTPQDFVVILNKMKNEFGMERIKTIFPTGNEGTLENYYKSEEGYIFAKTGTLSGVVALSGFIYTKKNKMLIFSILVNNHQASATQVRRAMEKFVRGLREKN